MGFELAVSKELHPTFHALLNFHVQVSFLVDFLVAVSDESFATVATLVFLFARVDLHVGY